ncbi:Beta/alpha-amylase precursor [compost metagenome]
MEASEVPGYSKYTVDIGTVSRLEVCFTDGKGNWDSNNSRNYFFNIGTWTYNGNGQIISGAPVSPAAASNAEAPIVQELDSLPIWPEVDNSGDAIQEPSMEEVTIRKAPIEKTPTGAASTKWLEAA